MPKEKITTPAQLKKYAQKKSQEFDRYVARFMRIFDEIAHRPYGFDYQDHDRIIKQQKQFKALVAELEELSAPAVPLWIKKIDNRLAAVSLECQKIEEYDMEFGAQDREAINQVKHAAQKADHTFKTIWKPTVKKALANQEYDRAAQLVVNLPAFDEYGLEVKFTGSTKLGEKHKRINNWIRRMSYAIPRPAILRAEIEKAAPGLAAGGKELQAALENFALLTRGLGALRGAAEDDHRRFEEALAVLPALGELLGKQSVQIYSQCCNRAELKKLTPPHS